MGRNRLLIKKKGAGQKDWTVAINATETWKCWEKEGNGLNLDVLCGMPPMWVFSLLREQLVCETLNEREARLEQINSTELKRRISETPYHNFSDNLWYWPYSLHQKKSLVPDSIAERILTPAWMCSTMIDTFNRHLRKQQRTRLHLFIHVELSSTTCNYPSRCWRSCCLQPFTVMTV